MRIGDKIETAPNIWVEIKTLTKPTARVFQLDNHKQRIPLYRKKGFLEGIMTIEEFKLLHM